MAAVTALLQRRRLQRAEVDASMQACVAAPSWLRSLRLYLGAIAVGNLVWETLQLPLYTIWRTGTVREQAFAVFHCMLGDLLIALSSLALALMMVGHSAWPSARFRQVAMLTIMFGVGYTTFSEWLNVVVRASWAYSELMPVIPLFGFRLGLSPLLQWIVVPAVAFGVVRWMTIERSEGGRR
jgi:hypothetical protein